MDDDVPLPKDVPIKVIDVPPCVGPLLVTDVIVGAEKLYVLVVCCPLILITTGRNSPCPTGNVHVILVFIKPDPTTGGHVTPSMVTEETDEEEPKLVPKIVIGTFPLVNDGWGVILVIVGGKYEKL
jgi:hypothetical protein